MDDIDRKIITELQKDARIPVKLLAEKVFLSSPAVSARIEKLENDKIILGYHATVDPVKLGYHIMAFVNLEIGPTQKNEFYQFIQKVPQVLECNYVTGDYSMLIKVAFPSTAELEVFIGQLQKFGRTNTQIVFSSAVKTRGVSVM